LSTCPKRPFGLRESQNLSKNFKPILFLFHVPKLNQKDFLTLLGLIRPTKHRPASLRFGRKKSGGVLWQLLGPDSRISLQD
jgi:hypothetical protein